MTKDIINYNDKSYIVLTQMIQDSFGEYIVMDKFNDIYELIITETGYILDKIFDMNLDNLLKIRNTLTTLNNNE